MYALKQTNFTNEKSGNTLAAHSPNSSNSFFDMQSDDEPYSLKAKIRLSAYDLNVPSSQLLQNYRSPEVFLKPRQMTLQPNYFEKVPDEVIFQIFAYLNKCSLLRCGATCRRFYQLSLDKRHWERLDLGGKTLSSETLHKLISRGIQYLRLSKADVTGTCHVVYWQQPCRLQYLDFSMAVDTEPAIIESVLKRCNNLVALSLEGCIVDDSVCVTLANNTNLQILNMSTVRGLTLRGIQWLVRGCRLLRELNVAWTNLCSRSVTYLCGNAPPTLKRLNLSGCREADSLVDEDVVMLCRCCPNLEELDISDSLETTQQSIQTVMNSLPKLRVLSCSRCYSIEPTAYTLVRSFLSEFNIFSTIKEESLPQLEQLLPKDLLFNVSVYSTIARPTTGFRRTSIWGHRVRDE